MNYIIAMLLLVSCMSTHNHVLYFAWLCTWPTSKMYKIANKNIQQRTLLGFFRRPFPSVKHVHMSGLICFSHAVTYQEITWVPYLRLISVLRWIYWSPGPCSKALVPWDSISVCLVSSHPRENKNKMIN